MTPTKRKALEDALKGLESELPYFGRYTLHITNAIAKIKAAIAEPEQESERHALTDQELEDALPTNDSMSRKDALRWMARWVERHHRIGT